jgi:uncharacterized membrane protein YhdT
METGNESAAKMTEAAGKSGLGIASFVLALISIGFNVWLIASLFAPESQETLAFAWPPGWVIIFCFPLPISFIGLLLGVRARNHRDRTYALLGIIGNALTFIPVILGALLLFSV